MSTSASVVPLPELCGDLRVSISADSYQLSALLHELEQATELAEVTPENREVHYLDWFFLSEQYRRFRKLLEDMEEKIAEAMPYEKTVTFTNGRQYQRSAKTSESWNKEKSDDLIRAVLDSRRIDVESGEILPETPTEKLFHVWPISGRDARVTALRERTPPIDPADFTRIEMGRAKLRELR